MHVEKTGVKKTQELFPPARISTSDLPGWNLSVLDVVYHRLRPRFAHPPLTVAIIEEDGVGASRFFGFSSHRLTDNNPSTCR